MVGTGPWPRQIASPLETLAICGAAMAAGDAGAV